MYYINLNLNCLINYKCLAFSIWILYTYGKNDVLKFSRMVIVGNSPNCALQYSHYVAYYYVRMHAVDSRTRTEISGERLEMAENELEISAVVSGAILLRDSLYMVKLVAPPSNRTLKGEIFLRAGMWNPTTSREENDISGVGVNVSTVKVVRDAKDVEKTWLATSE